MHDHSFRSLLVFFLSSDLIFEYKFHFNSSSRYYAKFIVSLSFSICCQKLFSMYQHTVDWPVHISSFFFSTILVCKYNKKKTDAILCESVDNKEWHWKMYYINLNFTEVCVCMAENTGFFFIVDKIMCTDRFCLFSFS